MHAEFVPCHSAGTLPSLRALTRCVLFGQIAPSLRWSLTMFQLQPSIPVDFVSRGISGSDHYFRLFLNDCLDEGYSECTAACTGQCIHTM